MAWICPKCKQKFLGRGNGLCLCSDTELQEIEEEDMSNTIKWAGNTERFAGQRRAVLLSAELQIVREIAPELISHIGGETPRGSAILCIYRGEKGIPFAELRNYGSAALLRLKKSVGQAFEIDVPQTEAKQVELDYGAGNHDSTNLPKRITMVEEVLREHQDDISGSNAEDTRRVQAEASEGIVPESSESGKH